MVFFLCPFFKKLPSKNTFYTYTFNYIRFQVCLRKKIQNHISFFIPLIPHKQIPKYALLPLPAPPVIQRRIRPGQSGGRRLQKNKNNGFKKKQECGNKNSGNKRHQNTQAEILSGFSFMKLPVFIRIILNGSRVNHRTKEIRDRKKGVIRPTAARPSMPTVLAAITDGEDFGPLPPSPRSIFVLSAKNE